MGELPFSHVFFDKRRFQSVQPEDDQLFDSAFSVSLLSFEESEKETERPGEEGKNSQEKSQKEDEEGRKKSKTCARPDIGLNRESE